jgi:hypothetical protein
MRTAQESMSLVSPWGFLLALTLFVYSVECSCSKTILYLPLDERYTTRDAFLNLAKLTPFCIKSPDTSILPSLKVSGDISAIHNWIDENVGDADAMIVSAEMFLYGGLIASRISNDTTAEVMDRATKLLGYSKIYPNLDVYVSNVVMRIPSYNGDFEEPWYWADYGYSLYTYSFFLDKYRQLHDASDLKVAVDAVSSVPKSAVEEFMWRRERNHNITMRLLTEMGSSSPKPFSHFYTTLDDSAEYGFNIREAQEIKDTISGSSGQIPSEACPVYPGADEVHLSLLAKFAGADRKQPLSLGVVYRDPSSINTIPAYEGQPMVETLEQQVAAAGGSMSVLSEDGSGWEQFDAFLFVNNFSGDQIEASEQPDTGDSSEYSPMFSPVIAYSYQTGSDKKQIPLGFCDNRYANGADRFFVQYMQQETAGVETLANLKWSAYAGWNTNGNTIGTVVANTLLLGLYGGDEETGRSNAAFNSLRILEDQSYQADLRQTLVAYVNGITNTEENTSNLAPDLDFYLRYTWKSLSSRYQDIAMAYGLPWSLGSTYFPWNRTFEIGFSLE